MKSTTTPSASARSSESQGSDVTQSTQRPTPVPSGTLLTTAPATVPSITNATKSGNCDSCPTAVSSVSSLAPSDSASNYDPAVQRLNLPKNVIEQLQKLVAQKPATTPAAPADPDAPTAGMRIRFVTSTCVLVSLGVVCAVGNALSPVAAGAVMVVTSLFALHWFIMYGSGLSRHRRAYFNEKNVLETYKIYDREFGHLFQKEPDTPGFCCGPPPKPGSAHANPVMTVGKDLIAMYQTPPQGKAEFSGAVQDHYGNMYDKIKRVHEEMDLLEKANKANQDAANSRITQSQSPLVPADIPIGSKPASSKVNIAPEGKSEPRKDV